MAAHFNSQFLAKVRVDLERDEGVKYEIYNDHLGHPTFGIGHLITKCDPENGKPVGTPVSKERVEEVFGKDIQTTLAGCSRLFKDFSALPEEAMLVIVNMMFNLGETNFAMFIKFRKAVDAQDWSKAADEMESSMWYKQVTARAKRLVERIRKLVR
uniref:Phage lysozyme 2 n=1 Tax=Sinohyriopsis cumingii TaxID=165450 RepID=A0A1L1ZYQ6_SINCU|nr:phage lysozyme 2 [Sinohyriopsis cumingii]